MSLIGGKRKVNKSLKAWVTFVKKVQKEEKLSYKDAIHRAKIRKDKGEKWMTGGDGTESTMPMETAETMETVPLTTPENEDVTSTPLMGVVGEELGNAAYGGRRRRRTMRRSRGRGRGKTVRRARRRSSRKH
jgi:hypothetical protein